MLGGSLVAPVCGIPVGLGSPVTLFSAAAVGDSVAEDEVVCEIETDKVITL